MSLWPAPTGLTGMLSGNIVTLTWTAPSQPVPSLLLHFDGVNGGAVVYDSSPNNYGVSVNTGARLETATTQFGTAALGLSGSSGDISITATGGGPLDVMTGDFTIECWLQPGGTASANYWSYGSSALALNQASGSQNVTLQVQTSLSITGPCPTGVFTHVAVVRQGTTVSLYTGGVLAGSVTASGSLGSLSSFVVGTSFIAGSNFLVDELRIIKGTAVYTSSFTPPTQPFGLGGAPPGYDVYRNGVSIATFVGSPTYTDTLPGHGTYVYTVTASGEDPSQLLLLHLDGNNGATSTVDSSSYSAPMTMQNGVALTTTNPKFGSASAAYTQTPTGNMEIVYTPITGGGQLDIFTLPSWTIEFQIMFLTQSDHSFFLDYGGVISGGLSSNAILSVTPGPSNPAVVFNNYSAYASGGNFGGALGSVIATGVWHHVAFVNNNGTGTAYFDGAAVGSVLGTLTPANYNGLAANEVVMIGSSGRVSSFTEQTQVDEFRVSNYAVYTAAFTPPTAPFSNPGDLSPPSGPFTIFFGTDIHVYGKFAPAAAYPPTMLVDAKGIRPVIWKPKENVTVYT